MKHPDSLEDLLTKMVEDTVIFITKDLHSLMTHEEVVKIRRYHKDEILKNIPEAKEAIIAKFKGLVPEKKKPDYGYHGMMGESLTNLTVNNQQDEGFNKAIDQITKSLEEWK